MFIIAVIITFITVVIISSSRSVVDTHDKQTQRCYDSGVRFGNHSKYTKYEWF